MKEPTREELLHELEKMGSRLSQVEDEWREVTNTFSQALEQGSAAVYRRNFDSDVYEYIGKGIEDITGYSADSITPAIWDEIVISAENKGDLAGFPLEEANRRVRSGEVDRWMSDTQLRTQSGSICWVTDMSTVLRDSSGHAYGCLGILYDITGRKRVEQELARTTEELRDKNDEMQTDLNMAREMQLSFIAKQYTHFPQYLPIEQSAIQFHHRYLPTSTLAGDFFTIFPLSDHEVGVLICDVMGHGTRASLLTAYMRGLIEELMPVAADTSTFFNKLNAGLLTVFTQFSRGMFATAFYLVANISSGSVTYSNAGHPLPFVLRRKQGIVEQLEYNGKEQGPALGLVKGFSYPVYNADMHREDIIFLFTDGLYEVMNGSGELYGKIKLRESLERGISLPPVQLCDTVLDDVYTFTNTDEFNDDVCLIAMHVRKLLD